MANNSKHGGGGPRKPGGPPRGPGRPGGGEGFGGGRDGQRRPYGGDKPGERRGAGERPRPAERDASPGGWRRKEPAADRPERPFRTRFAPQDGEAPRARARKRQTVTPEASAFAGERIAKVMARAGRCSRREAEEWITAGRVTVNGAVLESPAKNVEDGDRILVDGQPLGPRERTRLFLFHKPRGLVSTNDDPEGRPTIFDALPEDLPRLISVGRLDINTEGLLLLTNDGGLARVLELPATGWLRRYRVRANGETDQAQLDALGRGVTIEGVDYAGIEAQLDRQQGANVWLTMGLREGKNREIKRVLESLRLEVNRLIRVSFGPFQLGDLAEGTVEEVRTRVLRDQLGDKLARDAGVDFDSPSAGDTRGAERSAAPRGERSAPRGDDRPRRPRERLPEATPVTPPHPGRPKPAARKHVSVIRRERGEQTTEGPRVRIERGGTADRKGRAVAVERVVSTETEGDGRNARRFRRERRFADPVPETEGRERPNGPGRYSKEKQGFGGPRSRRDEKPSRGFEDGKRGPRTRDSAPEPGRTARFGPRPGGGSEGRPRREGAPWSPRQGGKPAGAGRGGPGRPPGKGGPRFGGPGKPRPPGKGPRPPR